MLKDDNKSRRLHEAAETRGLFHAGQGKLWNLLLVLLKASYLDATKVFALLWHQSMTGERPKFELSEEISVTRGPFQQEIRSSIQRMVVVKEGRGHCWCL